MKRIILSLCIIAFAFSCSTDSTTETQPPESNFYALTVGNSWVYKNYKYNPTTLEYEDTGIIEEVKIIGTETINGEMYFKFKNVTTGNDTEIPYFNENGEEFWFYRAFLGDLINENGDVIFTNDNYDERLVSENTWGNIYDKLTNTIAEIEVTAGLFNCLDMERYLKSPDNTELYPALDHFYYSDGVGLISNSFSFISQNIPIAIRRLESYNVQ